LKKLALFGIAMALASTAVAGQAFAGDQEVIVDGTVLGGTFDVAGVKTKVAGASYQEIFEVDVADLALSPTSATGSAIDSVSITIDGSTLSFAPTSSTVSYETSGGTSTWDMSASDGQTTNASFDIGSYSTFSNPFTTTVDLTIAGNPNFYYTSSYQQFVDKNTDLSLAPASVFPEPSMWALMIGGVSLAGLLLRRKSETTGVAATVLG
jgi:hypothetical protein